jgi:hypothetical protein
MWIQILVLFVFYSVIFSLFTFVIYETVNDATDSLNRYMASLAVGLSLTGFAIIITSRKLWELLSSADPLPFPSERENLRHESPIQIEEITNEIMLKSDIDGNILD